MPLGPPADHRYARFHHHLTRQGTPIHPNDLLIAAHALAADLLLVTANMREFQRVPAAAGFSGEVWVRLGAPW
jgi:tRNA(fMet)-specific endonuclease VapC